MLLGFKDFGLESLDFIQGWLAARSVRHRLCVGRLFVDGFFVRFIQFVQLVAVLGLVVFERFVVLVRQLFHLSFVHFGLFGQQPLVVGFEVLDRLRLRFLTKPKPHGGTSLQKPYDVPKLRLHLNNFVFVLVRVRHKQILGFVCVLNPVLVADFSEVRRNLLQCIQHVRLLRILALCMLFNNKVHQFAVLVLLIVQIVFAILI